MASWFENGDIAWTILAIIAAEALGLAWLARRRRDRRWSDIVGSLGAGAALVIALQRALVDAPWPEVAAALGLSFVAHLVDLQGRWIRSP